MMRKGQYALLEQVILFGLGILITLGFLFAFQDLSGTVKEDIRGSQAAVVSEYVTSAAVELTESGAEGTMTIPIPENIAAEPYAVQLGDGGMKVEVGGDRNIAPLYGLESRLETAGSVESRRGLLAVSLTDSRLEIRRAD